MYKAILLNTRGEIIDYKICETYHTTVRQCLEWQLENEYNYYETKLNNSKMTQIRKIRAGWKCGSDQHRISAAIDKYLWIWLQEKPNKNRTINQALAAMREKEHQELEEMIKLCDS